MTKSPEHVEIAAARTVVAIVTEDDDAAHAVRWAAEEAALRRADLNLVAVIRPDGSVAGPTGRRRGLHDADVGPEMLLAEARAVAQDVARAQGHPTMSIGVQQHRGPFVRTLVAMTADADIMVIGRLGVDEEHPGRRGGARAGLVEATKCPILYAVRPRRWASLSRPPVVMAVPVGDQMHHEAVACAEAVARDTSLLVIRADADHGRGAHDRICALPGVTEPSAVTERRVHPSAFIEALVTASETAQLIVVRAQDLSRHRRHDRHLDDHDGEIIVHAAECPVMIVPTPSGVVDSIAHRLLGVLHV